MRAVLVWFDTLNRRYLPPYGTDWVHAPNFTRLAERSVTFENCYAGSMACVPARRELHTGRYNFLHRGWGPLEPFDDSMPELLKNAGVYTHLVSDHPHYWDDGGATYHGRYHSWEFCRGQEGDPWKGQVADPATPKEFRSGLTGLRRHDAVNRGYMGDESDHPQTKTFDAGLEFINTNAGQDRWLCQIEAFDPHEPFFSPQRFRDLYPHAWDGPVSDWPDYREVTEPAEVVERVRHEYAALLSMCDYSLGRLLDTMDALELWDDTLLMVATDHGSLLGEHGWWGKAVVPWWDEIIHTPLFVWDPRSRRRGQRRQSLVQTIDLAPTLLEFFDVPSPADMQGAALTSTLFDDTPVREAGLFGVFGGHVNVTDGRYVYMRGCADPDNEPLVQYTLMPTRMRARFTPGELACAKLVGPLPFTKDCQVLRLPGRSPEFTPRPAEVTWKFGSLLYDLETDPGQQNPLVDNEELELAMARLLVGLMRANDAPVEQFTRLGLPATGEVDSSHLQTTKQQPGAR